MHGHARHGLPLVVIVAFACVGFSLRTPMTTIGAVLQRVQADSAMPAWAVAFLTALPSVCFSMFGALAPFVLSRVGQRACLGACIALTASGAMLRSLPLAHALLIGQAIACAGIAVLNVQLPALIKARFPAHVGRLTGVYSMALSVGAALGAGVTARLADTSPGGWRTALAIWAVPAIAAVPASLQGFRASGETRLRTGGVAGMPPVWRTPLAWQVTLFMGLQSAMGYTRLAGCPPCCSRADCYPRRLARWQAWQSSSRRRPP